MIKQYEILSWEELLKKSNSSFYNRLTFHVGNNFIPAMKYLCGKRFQCDFTSGSDYIWLEKNPHDRESGWKISPWMCKEVGEKGWQR